MGTPWRITVHHEGSDTDDLFTEPAVAERLRTITKVQEQSVDEGGLGAGDLAYHFVIDRSGRIWEGRSLSWQGAHAGNGAANTANVGVVLLGNFDVQEPTASQLLSLQQLLANLCQRYAIRPENIYGHDEVKGQYGLPPTRCPGRYLSAWLRSYRWQSAWSRAAR
jgi:N-acetyl-anhydromuramyl-L-alanine amidase AmpD